MSAGMSPDAMPQNKQVSTVHHCNDSAIMGDRGAAKEDSEAMFGHQDNSTEARTTAASIRSGRQAHTSHRIPARLVVAIPLALLLSGCSGGSGIDGAGTSATPNNSASLSADSTSPSTTSTPVPSSTSPSSSPSATVASTSAVAVYQVGAPDKFPVLYREYQAFSKPTSQTAIGAITMATQAALAIPTHPNRLTVWPSGSVVRSVTMAGSTATIDLNSAAAGSVQGRTRLAGEALAAQQELVWTATGAVLGLSKVAITINGAPVSRLWGQSVPSGAQPRGMSFAVLAPVWVLGPLTGANLTSPFTMSGQATVYEAVMLWEARKLGTTTVIGHGRLMSDAGGPARALWHTSVTLPKGDYMMRIGGTSGRDGGMVGVEQFVVTVR